MNSVIFGIEYLRRHEVFMTSESKNLLVEQSSYAWKKVVTGHYLSEPNKKYQSHLMNTCRYASTRLRGAGQRFAGFTQYRDFACQRM